MKLDLDRGRALSGALQRYASVRRRYRLAALVALPLSVCAATYTLLLAAQRDAQVELQVRVEAATRQRNEKLAYLANAHAFGDKLAALEGKLRQAHLALPDDPEVPQFLAQLGTMAHDVGLTIERFAPQPEVPRDFYAESSFGVQVRGSFHQIAMMLAQVGAMERIVTVRNLSLELRHDAAAKDGNGASKGVVDGAFEVTIYRLLRDDEVAAGKDAKDGKAGQEGTPG